MAPMLTPTIKTSSMVFVSWLTLQSTATAGGFLEDAVSGVVNTAVKAVNDTANTGKKAIDDTVKTVEKAGQDAGETGKKAVDDTLNTGKKAIDDVLRNSTKAVDDVARNAVKSANDIVDAGKAVERFVEYQVQGVGDSLSDAEKRVREGKIVDAAWHLGTDPYKHTEEGAAKAAQESQLINAAGQAAASFYGGPAGAAAYASWYAYRATNDINMAIRVGVITGVTSAGYASAGAMPAGSVGEVAKKAYVTGAIGGIAVAASGGDEAAVRDAFLKSGGMVVVQSGQSYINKTYVNPAVAKTDSYCMSAVGAKCSVILPKLRADAQGKILLDENGQPKLDTSAILPNKADVKPWQDAAAANQESVRRFANQIFTKDEQWAISWDKNALVNKSASIPAVVMTYTGPGSPFDEKVQDIKAWAVSPVTSPVPASKSGNPGSAQPPAAAPTWIALNDIGAQSLFDRVFPNKQGPIAVGDILKTKKDMSMRSAPADTNTAPTLLMRGSLVSVTGTTALTDEKGRAQDWARIEIVASNAGLDAETDAGTSGDLGAYTGETTGLKFPIWCFEKNLRHGFEVRADSKVRGLTTDFNGVARRSKDGSIRIRAARPADLGWIDLPWQEAIRAQISASGELTLTDITGAKSSGQCRSVI
jgi:hypothetical protein